MGDSTMTDSTMTFPANLLDRLDTQISLTGATDELLVTLPQLPASHSDAILITRHAAWGASDAASRALEQIATTKRVSRTRTDCSLRLKMR
jgi:hypothetical protein